MYYYNIMNALSMGYSEACDILDVDDDCKVSVLCLKCLMCALESD